MELAITVNRDHLRTHWLAVKCNDAMNNLCLNSQMGDQKVLGRLLTDGLIIIAHCGDEPVYLNINFEKQNWIHF